MTRGHFQSPIHGNCPTLILSCTLDIMPSCTNALCPRSLCQTLPAGSQTVTSLHPHLTSELPPSLCHQVAIIAHPRLPDRQLECACLLASPLADDHAVGHPVAYLAPRKQDVVSIGYGHFFPTRAQLDIRLGFSPRGHWGLRGFFYPAGRLGLRALAWDHQSFAIRF